MPTEPRTNSSGWPAGAHRHRGGAPTPRVGAGRFGLVGLVVCGIAAATTNADAYIDPGTGSYIFQLAVAGGLAVLFTLKRYWHRIKEFLGGRQRTSKPPGSSEA